LVQKSLSGSPNTFENLVRPRFQTFSCDLLNQPAADGCNWTIDSVLILPGDLCVACNAAVVVERKKFNPGMIIPMLARLVGDPFDRVAWLFELKWDGFRAIAETDRVGTTARYSRNQ